jgi:hypothetical protein
MLSQGSSERLVIGGREMDIVHAVGLGRCAGIEDRDILARECRAIGLRQSTLLAGP